MPSTEEYEALIAKLKAYTPPPEAKRPDANAGADWKRWIPRFSFAPQSDGAPLLLWSVGVVFATGAIGTISGWILGAWMGTYNPKYYVAIFLAERDPNFDPYQVAIGLGVSQGAAAGFGSGLVLVALFYVYRYFMKRMMLRRLNGT